MRKLAICLALGLAAAFAAPAFAQTDTPPSPAPDATLKHGKKPAAHAATASDQITAPKLTAAERRDKAKLDHDLKICIGC